MEKQLDMAHTLIQIGNSKALIIPAKIIRKKSYDNKTEFNIIETNNGFRIEEKHPALESLDFPKASRPALSATLKRISGIARFSQEEIEHDDKLKYILSR